jgi:hypothetical protein
LICCRVPPGEEASASCARRMANSSGRHDGVMSYAKGDIVTATLGRDCPKPYSAAWRAGRRGLAGRRSMTSRRNFPV